VSVRPGVVSEVLTTEMARNTAERGAQAEWGASCSHPPTWISDDQVIVVHEWRQWDAFADEEGGEAPAEEGGLDMDEKTEKDS